MLAVSYAKERNCDERLLKFDVALSKIVMLFLLITIIININVTIIMRIINNYFLNRISQIDRQTLFRSIKKIFKITHINTYAGMHVICKSSINHYASVNLLLKSRT